MQQQTDSEIRKVKNDRNPERIEIEEKERKRNS